MSALASVFVGLAAVLHGYIFWMESIAWTRPQVWKRFGVAGQAQADTTRPMAYNQGFYNLFLGLGAALGIVLWWSGSHDAGKTLMLFCTASMALAATVLVTTGKGYLRAALAQGTVPLIGFVLTLFI